MPVKRLWTIFFFAVFLTGVLSWKLFCVQVVEGGIWKAQAQGQQRYFTQTQGERGSIYLANGDEDFVPVALNRKTYHVFISPKELSEKKEDKEEMISLFTQVLEVGESEVLEKLEKKESSYEILKKNISSHTLEKVKETSGLHIQEEVVRYYPEKDLASHVIGFLGGEKKGQYGVEQYYDEIIGGRPGIIEGIRMKWLSFITKDSTKRGEDLLLTIDYNVQHFVEKELQGAVERLEAKEGTVVVGDPQTGEILAMANYPDFDPNEYSIFSQEEFNVFKNSAVQETFEPGSVFKPITMAIALNSGAVSPEDTFYDSGEKRIHGKVIRNYEERSYGFVDMTEILKKSINTGIAYVQEQIGNEVFLKYLYDFKFFEPTGIDLHGEVCSQNKEFLKGYDINFTTASYGQGIEVTSIQLFRAFSVLANGGRLVDPHVVKKDAASLFPGERIISPTAASLVTEMMVETVEKGFGSTAKIPGYYIAGKTGTAQVAWSKLGISKTGYADKATIQGFVGYAPAFDPQFVIFVKLDQPQTRSAEVSSAPVFREIARFLLEYKKIPYDYEVGKEKDD